MKALACFFVVVVTVTAAVLAQTTASQPAPTALGGVAITSNGLLQMRKVAPVATTRRAGDPSLTYVSLTKVFSQIQQAKGTAGKLLYDPALYDEARTSITEAKRLLDDLNAGKGSAGKLLKDEEVYRQLTQIADKLNTAIDKINSGQGTIGQLVVNPALYQSLDSTTREINGLMKDFRANPKKFLRIKLGLF